MHPIVFLLVALAAPVSGGAGSPLPPRAEAQSARPAVIGTWRATAFNRRALPAIERIPATDGWHHYVKLEQAVVTLRADGRFVASFRFWHHHMQDGTRVPDAPVMSETHRGTYVVRGGTVIFQPETRRKDRRPVTPLTGTIANGALQVRYAVRDGKSTRALRLDLARDASW